METVDKMLVKPVKVVHCSHLSGSTALWIEDRAGRAPHLAFKGFPGHGAMIMSIGCVIVACERCQGALYLMEQDHLA